MKVCHITSAHSHDDVRILKKECVSLAKVDDLDVYLVCEGESQTYKGVTIIGNGEKPGSRLKRMGGYAKKVVLSALKINADVYHFHDPELLRYTNLLKKSGAKVIFDCHENIIESIDEKSYLPTVLRKGIKLYLKKLLKKVSKKLDAIVIVTPQQRNIFNHDTIVLIPNFPIVENEYDIVEKNDDDQLVFMFAGDISEQWSHEEIIEAINSFDNIKYELYGPVADQYLEKLKKVDGWDKVDYKGQKPFEIVQKRMKQVTCVFALLKPGKNTFYNEGTLGNTKIFEAMANAIPLIATDFSLWREIIGNSESGILVDPNNVDAIKEAIFQIIHTSEEERKQIGINGRKCVVNNYSWSATEPTLYNLYSNILSWKIDERLIAMQSDKNWNDTVL